MKRSSALLAFLFCVLALPRVGLAGGFMSERDLGKRIKLLEKQMLEHARNLEFEKAARVRDQLALLREQAFGASVPDVLPLGLAQGGGR